MTATLVLCATLAAPAAPVPKERADAEKVVGVWKLVRSSKNPDGLTVDLTLELLQGGKLVIRQSSGGRAAVYEGEYKVVKDTLPYRVTAGVGIPDLKEETLTIKKLTETELQVVDPDGIQEDFVRVKKDGK
jgi:uncharacterized protein (TIGR03066 family)